MTQTMTRLPRQRSEIAVWRSGEPGRFVARNRRTGEAFRMGEEEFFLFHRMDGSHSTEQVIDEFERKFGERLSVVDINDFLSDVDANGFLVRDESGSNSGPESDTPGTNSSDASLSPETVTPRRPRAITRISAAILAGVSATLAAVADRLNCMVASLHSYRLRRFDFDPRPDDIFIVTYPRSGTTWMQMILYQLTTSGSMEIPHIAEYCPWFEKSRRFGRGFESLPSPRILKTHLSYRRIPKGPCKYIYVARDGRDVALSYYHLCRSHLNEHAPFSEFYDRFLKGNVVCGSWFEHVHDWWIRRDDPNVLFLRYEDLKRDVKGSVRRIATFCGIDITAEKLNAVVDRCHFDFMKQHESRFDPALEFLWEEGVRLSSFIRNGRVGDGIKELSDEQRAHFATLYRHKWKENELGLG